MDSCPFQLPSRNSLFCAPALSAASRCPLRDVVIETPHGHKIVECFSIIWDLAEAFALEILYFNVQEWGIVLCLYSSGLAVHIYWASWGWESSGYSVRVNGCFLPATIKESVSCLTSLALLPIFTFHLHFSIGHIRAASEHDEKDAINISTSRIWAAKAHPPTNITFMTCMNCPVWTGIKFVWFYNRLDKILVYCSLPSAETWHLLIGWKSS